MPAILDQVMMDYQVTAIDNHAATKFLLIACSSVVKLQVQLGRGGFSKLPKTNGVPEVCAACTRGSAIVERLRFASHRYESGYERRYVYAGMPFWAARSRARYAGQK
jgi:hypothetical protein